MSDGSNEELATLSSRIRTITLLLSVVRPQAGSGLVYLNYKSKPDDEHLRLLDQIALFFVSSAQGDVAAVSAAITPDTVEVLLSAKFQDGGPSLD
jgi:hypothetical protein